MNGSDSGTVAPSLTASRLAGGVIGTGLFLGGMLWAAGRLDWWRGWIYLGLLLSVQAAGGVLLWRRDPELIRRRGRPGPGTPRWDVGMLALFGLGYAGTVVLAALDSGRHGWSTVPTVAWVPGAILVVAGSALAIWAMSVNTHFEKTVRIQHDRAHRAVTDGPYRIVRHPGYVGASLSFPLAAPLCLGSWWAFLPATLSVLALVARTALEDRLLRRELAGYETYAARVRFRLLPGIW